MFDNGQDPWQQLQKLEAQTELHHTQIKLLENNINQLVRAYNAQAQLMEQIAEQNTHLLDQLAVLRGFSRN
jgi:hypothetical protein